MRMLYGLRVLRDLVGKLSFFFLPIYLFQFGQRVDWLDAFGWSSLQRGVVMIAVFFVVVRLIVLVSAIPIGRLLARRSYQMGLVFGSLLQVGTFALLYLSEQQPLFIWLAMVAEALQINFFWNSFHVVLSKNMRIEHVGQDLSTMQFLLQLITAISPAIGGMMAVAFGVESLFLVGTVGSLLSLLFAFGLNLGHEHDTLSWQELGQWLKQPEYRKLSVSFIGRYMNDMVLFVWPLYIFLLLGSIDEVGFLYTVSLFLALIVTFFTGVYVTKHNSRKPFMISGAVLSLLWLFRAIVITPWSIALVDMFEKLTANFHWLYFDMQFMRRGKGAQALSYYTYREIVMSLGAVGCWLLFALIFLLIPLGWYTLFVIAAVAVVVSLLVRDRLPT